MMHDAEGEVVKQHRHPKSQYRKHCTMATFGKHGGVLIVVPQAEVGPVVMVDMQLPLTPTCTRRGLLLLLYAPLWLPLATLMRAGATLLRSSCVVLNCEQGSPS
jgi:hypothetical protein